MPPYLRDLTCYLYLRLLRRCTGPGMRSKGWIPGRMMDEFHMSFFTWQEDILPIIVIFAFAHLLLRGTLAFVMTLVGKLFRPSPAPPPAAAEGAPEEKVEDGASPAKAKDKSKASNFSELKRDAAAEMALLMSRAKEARLVDEMLCSLKAILRMVCDILFGLVFLGVLHGNSSLYFATVITMNWAILRALLFVFGARGGARRAVLFYSWALFGAMVTIAHYSWGRNLTTFFQRWPLFPLVQDAFPQMPALNATLYSCLPESISAVPLQWTKWFDALPVLSIAGRHRRAMALTSRYVLLRIMSFNLDMAASLDEAGDGKGDQRAKAKETKRTLDHSATECHSVLNVRNEMRDVTSVVPSVLQYGSYMFFVPLFMNGPSVPYSKYDKFRDEQTHSSPSSPHTTDGLVGPGRPGGKKGSSSVGVGTPGWLWGVLRTGGSAAFLILFLDFAVHYFYYPSVLFYALDKVLTPVEWLGYGVCHLFWFFLSNSAYYQLARTFSLMDGLKTNPEMPTNLIVASCRYEAGR